MKKNKKMLISLNIFAFSSLVVSSFVFPVVSGQITISSNAITLDDSFKTNTQAVGTITETATTFTFKNNSDVLWSGKKFANEVTSEDIVAALQPKDPGANFFVEIQQINQSDLENGIVRFKLIQNLRTFTNGVQTSITQTEIKQNSNSQDNIWSTPNGLVKSKKYQFGWNSDEVIGNYIKSTNKKISELTKKDVYENMLDLSLNLPPLDKISISTSNLNSTNSMSLYGVGNLKVSFQDILDDKWVNNTKPADKDLSKTLRGFITDANVRETMKMQFSTDSIANQPLSEDGKKQYENFLLNPSNAKFGDLFASQFLSANNGSNQTLIDIMTKGLYSTNTSPLASLTYMGKSITDNGFFTSTGLDEASFKSKLKIESIEPSINDGLGSMSLVYNFTYLDIFTNTTMQGKAVQNYPDKTFKENVDAGKNLIFEWKEDEMIAGSSTFAGIGTSFDIVNNYYSNQNNPEYLLNLSNQFFIGSNDTYNKSRTVKIDYLGGGSVSSLTGAYEPTVNNQTTIEVTITFDTWNGNIYSSNTTPTTRSKQYGFTSTKKFNLKQYNYQGQETVKWTSQTNLFNQYPFLNTITPSDVAFEVSKSIGGNQTRFIDKEAFYKISDFNDNIDSQNVIFYPNDVTGVLEVRIYTQKNQDPVGSGRVHSQFFTGFKKVTNSTTVEFGWIPQSQVSGQLLNQDIEDVSVQNVIDLYLIHIPLFKEAVLSADNVSIQIDPKNNSNLLVYVTIPLFNQDQVNPGTQTFVTSISGFGRVTPQNIADFTAPDNFTVLISVLLVSILAITTGVVLMTILIRQFSLKKIKKSQIDLKKKKNKK